MIPRTHRVLVMDDDVEQLTASDIDQITSIPSCNDLDGDDNAEPVSALFCSEISFCKC